MRERFVVLGAAPVRREWFSNVSRWAHEAALPIEFIKCISANEVISRLESSRPFSALIIDGSTNGLDQDLLDLAASVGCSPIVVDHGLVDRDWSELGAKAVIPERFDSGDLLSVLEDHANRIGFGSAEVPTNVPNSGASASGGNVIAVTGAGGVGTSTVAMALAQGLAAQQDRQPTVLVDMALRANQAMLHDTRDVVPGLLEFVESHRLGTPSQAESIASVHRFPERGYDLLLGLRHERDWMSIPARALAASWGTLTNRYETVVSDITGDFDGLKETGSTDIEERNRLARTAAGTSDLVLVVCKNGAWGMRHLIATIVALEEVGVPAHRLVPVINHAPRNPRAKAEIQRSITELLDGRSKAPADVAPPVFVPFRKELDSMVGGGAPLPNPVCQPLVSVTQALLEQPRSSRPQAPMSEPEPVAVAPGSLGTWSEDDE